MCLLVCYSWPLLFLIFFFALVVQPALKIFNIAGNTVWEILQDDIIQMAMEKFVNHCRGTQEKPDFRDIDDFLAVWRESLGELAE